MKINEKRALLDYLVQHNDGSIGAECLIRIMTAECNSASVICFDVGIEDLKSLSESVQGKLRRTFSKKDGEDFTIQECQVVADNMEEMLADEFGENLINTINNM